MQEPRAAVSSFQISGRYGVYGQGSASPVLRGWSQERKGQVSVWLQTVPTLSRPLSLSLPASPFNSPFNSSLVFFSYSFSLSLSLFDFALSFSVYAHRSSHLRPSLDSFLFPTAAAHPPHDFAGVLTGSSISTWTYGKLVETLLRSVFQGGGISSAFSGARWIGRNWTGYKLDKVKLNFLNIVLINILSSRNNFKWFEYREIIFLKLIRHFVLFYFFF